MPIQFVAVLEQTLRGTRCVLLNRTGRVMASASEAHRQLVPQPGWLEEDAAEIWYKTKKVWAAATDINRTAPAEIIALGVTNQPGTTVVWDSETGEPYYHAIAGPDKRTRDICARMIADGLDERIRAKTGLPVATDFSAPKLKWLLDNIKGLRRDAEQGRALFGTVDTWLIWNLSGAHVTDYTNASRTMLMNLQTCDWDDEMLAWFGIPRAMLPQVRPSADLNSFGYTRERWPFDGEIHICGDISETQAVLSGLACFERGEAAISFGGRSCLIVNTGRSSAIAYRPLQNTIAYTSSPSEIHYGLESRMPFTDAALRSLQQNYANGESLGLADSSAGMLEDAGGVCFVCAPDEHDVPDSEQDTDGVMVGATSDTTQAQLVRATLEAIGYSTREVLEAMEQAAGLRVSILKADGNAARSDLFLQIQANISGIPVVRPAVTETAALGAAYTAGLAAGYWMSKEEIRSGWRANRMFEPRWDQSKRDESFRRWQLASELVKHGYAGEGNK